MKHILRCSVLWQADTDVQPSSPPVSHSSQLISRSSSALSGSDGTLALSPASSDDGEPTTASTQSQVPSTLTSSTADVQRSPVDEADEMALFETPRRHHHVIETNQSPVNQSSDGGDLVHVRRKRSEDSEFDNVDDERLARVIQLPVLSNELTL